ncbi:MAG TPA: MlaD family protein [Gemmatimonadaceae bacterium]|jgi:ABC-type transporter Mla subunit MlaD|nr:MlaD family protein [Gemmatimonadaceae bacterium]
MPRQLHWRDLTGGIIAVGVLAVITIAVLLFARLGGLHGKKVTLYVVTEEAPGVLPGTEVWIAGQKQGVVKHVSFQPATVPEMERILIETELLEDALPNVRKNSYARIRSGGTIIGAPVVAIRTGTINFPQLHEGDTVHARPPRPQPDLAEDITALGPAFTALGVETGKLRDNISKPSGTMGAYSEGGLPDLADVSAGISSLNARATQGRGTLALAMRGDLRARASHAMASADTLRNLMSSNKGSIGRFRKDTTLVTNATHILAEVDTLRSLFANPVGAIAAAHPDSALTRQLDRTHVLLASLIKDVKSNPTRYIRF